MMRESGRQLLKDDLLRLEKAIERPLPEPYRNFLLVNNGGRPTPNIIDIDGAYFKGTDIKMFLGIDHTEECCDIFWNLEILEGYKESQYLPIAHDSFGLIFVIDLAPETYGQVFYVDMVESVQTPYFVARDFNEFLNKLREPTPWERGDEDEPQSPA